MKINKKSKTEGQVFTPNEIVDIILNDINYKGSKILNKKIIEPSFGEGIFLFNILNRIIKEARKNKLSDKEIVKIIEENVYGIEKDKELYEKTINSLNDFLHNKNIYEKVNWSNLINGDTLIEYEKFIEKFDYVVGNPPYIRIHNLSKEIRDNILNFDFTEGNTDLYIVFYVIGIKILNKNGKLGFITPNSFLKNSSQKKFRNYLIDNNYLEAIYDFKSSEVFDKFNVYACICLLNKVKQYSFIKYREYDMYNKKFENKIQRNYFNNNFKNKAWNFTSKENEDFLKNVLNKKQKINDIAIVQNGISTNLDKIYISKVYLDKDEKNKYCGKHSDKNKIVYFNGFQIESNILRRCVKASKYDGIIDNIYVIFPYEYNENGYNLIKEDDLRKKYPLCYKYLNKHKNLLLNRDMESNSLWYQFARSQGLLNMNSEKIIFKHIIDKNIKNIEPYVLEKDIVVYSGLYITLYNNKNKNKVINIIKSKDFKLYCELVGKDMAGGYFSVSSKHIQNYGID